MDIEKNIFLINGEDKTKNITSCVSQGNKYLIRFGQSKEYSYNKNNVKWLTDPKCLLGNSTVVYKNNIPLSKNDDKIFDFGTHIKIISANGYQKIYISTDLEVKSTCLNKQKANNQFKYLQRLAQYVSTANEDEESFLKKQYDKLSFISPESVLSKYLNKVKDITSNSVKRSNIYPFGFNLSQARAVEKAFAKSISIIEGPPGTGKTQTILNIIANAIINHETVAIVSNNNSATSNVLENLEKHGVGFIAAYLGNKKNKEKFFANQSGLYPDFTAWEMSIVDCKLLEESIHQSRQQLQKMLKAKKKTAVLKQELSAISVEKMHFDYRYKDEDFPRMSYPSICEHNSDNIINFWIDYQHIARENKKVGLLYKLKKFFTFGISSFSFYNNQNEVIIHFFQQLYYQKKIKEIQNEIQKLKKILEEFQFDKEIAKYSANSMSLFKAKLANKFSKEKERMMFTDKTLWQGKDFDEFIEEYPVILSTTHSLRNSTKTNYLFDYVIMDEASQVDIVTGALALSCAKNAIVVGDLKQLPNVVTHDVAKSTNRVFNEFFIDSAYHYAENSILSSIIKLYVDVPKTLLKEHYRCHPMIIGFCNQKFYDNELIILTDENGQKNPMVVYKTVKGNHARGNYNQRQIDVILKEILPERASSKEKSIGIISPYNDQVNAIKGSLETKDIEVGTVHKYQGREKDIIIFTTVANEINDFVDDPNLVNVAVSRAVEQFILVVSDNEKNKSSNIDDLIKYVEYNNCEIIQSSISSVFDLLYKRYNKQMLDFIKHRKKVSEYESENLMIEIIEKVLRIPEFFNLGYTMNQPLKMLISNFDKLDENEYKFANNILTHTDFLIFNKMDRMPILVVEVDGYAFHANNPKQLKRDAMKDIILEKYGIPILRCATNESGEQERLKENLMNIQKIGIHP